MDEPVHSEPEGPGRLLHAGVGCLVLLVFLLVVPVLWSLLLPLTLTPLATSLYLVCVLVVCARVASTTSDPGGVLRSFTLAFVGYALLAAVLVAPLAGLKMLAADFGSRESVQSVRSPEGDFTAVVYYVDQGALGGFYTMDVYGQVVPGLVEWHHAIPTSGTESLQWIDRDTLRVQGREFDMPAVMSRLCH